jgi:hypothetical protein
MLDDGCDAVHTVLQSMDFWHNTAFVKGTQSVHPKNWHIAVMDKRVNSQPRKHTVKSERKKKNCNREEN